MIVKNSTAHSIDIGEAGSPLITELGRQIGFSFKRSVNNQIEFAKLYPGVAGFQEFQSPTNTVKEADVSVKENISFLSRVNQIYGVGDTQKYSGKTQRWEGYVTAIHEDYFQARIEDLTNPGTYEIIKFDLDEISPEDESLLKLGAVFYFSIGYVLNNGQREKTSLLRFKRIAEWTEEEFNRAVDRGQKLSNNLKWD